MKMFLLSILIFSFSGIAQTFNNTELNRSDSALVAFYPFNGNANDVTGNNHNGTVSGATLTTDRFGNPNSTYIFNGSSDFMDINQASTLNLPEYTYSAWINLTAYPPGINLQNAAGTILDIGGISVDQYMYIVNYNPYYGISGSGYYIGGGSYDARTGTLPNLNQWYHVAVTRGNTSYKLFVDGLLIQTVPLTAVDPDYGVSPVAVIGKRIGDLQYFTGKIDDIRIYNYPLTDAQVQSLFQSESTGLVAFYPFNGNANDESGNGYNGSVSGATLTTDRFNQTDKAYNFTFNGFSSDKIQVAGTSTLNFSTGSFSLSAWINFSGTASSGNNYPIVSKHTCGEQSGYILMLYNDKLTFWLAGSGGYNILTTTENYSDNSWHHVVAVYDDVNQYIYVDGVLKNSGPFVYNVYNSADLALGGYNGCNGGFNGKVDEVKIYNKPLSAAEIQNEYNTSYNDLVLFLPFNGNANDESGNGNNGTVSGAALTQDTFGVNGKAYSFDGIDDQITIADNPNLFSDDLTISWWYKLSEVPGSAWVVIGWVDGGHRYQQFFSGGQASYLNGYNVAQSGLYFNPIYALNDLNVWKNVVVTYKKLGETTSTSSIYIDGELKQTDNHSLAMDYVPGIDLSIGKNHNGNFFKGYFDDLRIYNRVLNAAEILALYQDSTTYNPPLEAGLVAYWPFDNNTDDSTNNNNDGINYNGAFSKDRYGNDNTSIFLNAVDSYVEGINPGNNLPIGNSPRSFSAWIRNNQYNQWGSNIFHYGTQQAAPTNFHFLITDVLGLGNGYGYGIVYGNTNLVDSTWHFVTGVYEGGTERITKLYVDGKIDNTGTISTEPNTILGTNWRVGRFMDGSTNFNGNIDELKVYDIPLTDQQVWDRYKATTTAPTLLFPNNDSTLVNNLNPILDWDSTLTATNYRLIMGNDSLLVSTFLDTLLDISSFYVYDGLIPNIDNIYWKVRALNDGGIGPWSELNRFQIVLTDVEDETQLPTEFALMQNYPNPFNPSTSIQYAIASRQFVELKVYDVLGNEVAILVDEEKPAGMYNVQFTMNNLGSGIYFYNLQAGSFSETKKLILLK